ERARRGPCRRRRRYRGRRLPPRPVRSIRRNAFAEGVELAPAADQRLDGGVPDRRIGRDVTVDRVPVTGQIGGVDRVHSGPDLFFGSRHARNSTGTRSLTKIKEWSNRLTFSAASTAR